MKTANLYTKLKGKHKKTIKTITGLTLYWCIQKWGVNKRRSTDINLNLDFVNKPGSCGEYYYQDNAIVVYVKHNRTIRDLIDTIIHEFTHQRQAISNYQQVLKKFGYDAHPLEQEAVAVAKEFRKQCWHEIKPLYTNLKF
jgi:hypothetical protein